MTRPNAQYPRGKKSAKDRDDAKYKEDKEKLEKSEEESSVPKESKN